MADSETPPQRPGSAEPASDAKKHASKLVVLSSVAKVPPLNEAESLLGEASTSEAGDPQDPKAAHPLHMPRKPGEDGLIRPVGWTTRPGGTTTIIKLPPKTGVLPRLTSLSTAGKKADAAPIHTAPPPLPIKVNEPADGEEETKRLPPIKLHPSTLHGASEHESIFGSPEDKPVEKSVAHENSPPDEKAAEIHPPPLINVRPGGAMPPPLPLRPTATSRDKAGAPTIPSPGKATTVLLSKSSRLPAASALVPSGLQATTRITPAPGPPPTIASSVLPSTEVKPEPRVAITPPVVEPPAVAQEKSRKPFFLFPPAKKKTKTTDTHVAPVLSSQTVKLTPASLSATKQLTEASIISARSGYSSVARTTEPEIKKPQPELFSKGPTADHPVSKISSPARPTTVVTPPKVFPGTAPTMPITPASRVITTAPSRVTPAVLTEADEAGLTPDSKTTSQANRAVRVRKRRVMGIIGFYVLLAFLLPALYLAALYFSKETRVEGQVIPPAGTVLGDEVWIVTDFRDLASGIASDLAGDRTMVMQEMQEKQDHVQRAQADVASREDRIRLLKAQIQTANDSQGALVRQAREASQHIWDGPGADLEQDYQSRLTSLDQAIRARAKSINIVYNPDPNFYSPEVWANAFRLGLYQVPKGVDPVKEHQWLEAQIKSWRDFTKSMDEKQNALRQQAAQLKMAPATKVADLKTQIDDLQQRIDGTIAEEEPLKAELEQAQTDLSLVQAKEAALDAKPLEKLNALPASSITKHLPLLSNGRFSWRELEKENKYAEDEKSHAFWIFARAFREDGRQYWALHRFAVGKDSTVLLTIEPQSFISTKAILRPDLSPDEQAQ